MRTEKELLINLRDWMLENFEKEKSMGICDSIIIMELGYELIAEKEYDLLHAIMRKHLPIKEIVGGYCWIPRLLAPRIEFLNKLIESYE